MQLLINDKSVDVKFNFGSLLLWRDTLKDADGKKQDDDNIYDQMFTSLVNGEPYALTQVIYGGLAYLGNDKPSFSVVFDAVSELMNEKDPDELAKEVLAELDNNGFFKAQLNHWKRLMESLVTQLQKGLELLEKNKPKKNASKEAQQAYLDSSQQLQSSLTGTTNSLELLADKLGVTETTSPSQDKKQESQA